MFTATEKAPIVIFVVLVNQNLPIMHVLVHFSLIHFKIVCLEKESFYMVMRLLTKKRPLWDINGANAGGKEPFRFRRRSTSDAGSDKAAAGVSSSSECGPRSSPPTYGL